MELTHDQDAGGGGGLFQFYLSQCLRRLVSACIIFACTVHNKIMRCVDGPISPCHYGNKRGGKWLVVGN